MIPPAKSQCCGAKIRTINGNEGTYHWECMNCGKPCQAQANYIGKDYRISDEGVVIHETGLPPKD